MLTTVLFCSQETCSLSVPATPEFGYDPDKDYLVTVMLEDYPDYTISVGDQVRSIRKPISKIPTQVHPPLPLPPASPSYSHYLEIQGYAAYSHLMIFMLDDIHA